MSTQMFRLPVTLAEKSAFVFQAALLALQEENMEASAIKHKYFLHALSQMSPSLTAQQIQAYETPPRWQITYGHILCFAKLYYYTKVVLK